MSYKAAQIPKTAELPEVIERVYNEFKQIEQSIGDIVRLPALSAAPARPRDGNVAYADGTAWDPGSGEGIYGYYAGDWHKLG